MKDYRQINREVMLDTKSLYETMPILKEAVKKSIRRQYMVRHEDNIDQPIAMHSNTKYLATEKRSFEAAKDYVGKKTAVLNFANNHHIGGWPYYAGAQEESLCRCSTLLPCLEAMSKPFYQKHIDDFNKGLLDALGNDDLIYTPNVVVFKTDERTDPVYPKMMEKSEWFKVDVISCSAPELFKISQRPENYKEIITSRIKKILDVAAKENVDVLILGAWGCGTFKNDPAVVNEVFYKLLVNYNFDTVVFALASNHDVSNSIFYPHMLNDEQYDKSKLKLINKKLLDYEESSLNGKHLCEEYKTLLNDLRIKGQKRSSAFEDDAISTVTLDVLSYRIKKICEQLGLHYLIQILDIEEDEILRNKGMGKKTWHDIIKLKLDIVLNLQKYLAVYHKYYEVHVLSFPDSSIPFYKRITSVISQFASIIEGRSERDAFLFRELFLNGRTYKEIASIMKQEKKLSPLTEERMRQIYVNLQSKIMAGEDMPIAKAYLGEDMIEELESLAKEILYMPLAYVNKKLQAPEDFDPRPIIRLLGLSIFDYANKSKKPYFEYHFVVSRFDTKIHLNIKAFNEVMSKKVLPASKDDILSEIVNSVDFDCNLDFLENVLMYSSLVECNDNEYCYKYEYLHDAKAKAARIVYLKKRVTSSEIRDWDKKYLGSQSKNKTFNQKKTIEAYPWVARGQMEDEWVYAPTAISSLPSLREATEVYAKQHIVFKFSDMMDYLRSNGYDKYADGSFRTYVLKYCVPSNTDGDLLCLESEIEKHNPSEWRSRTVTGTTNWVINSCVRILGDKKLKMTELSKRVFAQPEAQNYNIRYFDRISIYNYCCSEDDYEIGKLFVINEEGDIWVNQACLKEQLVDLETIGKIDKQPDYYWDVITKVVEQLKEADNHRLELAQLCRSCDDIIAPYAKTTFYKIIKRLPAEIERLEEGGTVYLQLKPEKLTYEESYSTIETNDSEEIAVPEVIVTQRSQYNQTKMIDWCEMKNALKSELDYYERWWDIDSKTIDAAIEDFVDFLQNTDNTVLHYIVSRHIYKVLTYKLDRYDLYDVLIGLSVNLETLIRNIYMHNNSIKQEPKTNGLEDCVALIPGLDVWSHAPYIGTQGFSTIYHQIKDKCRNKISHGVDVQMNTVKKYQTIYGCIALYVYIYTRFLEV